MKVMKDERENDGSIVTKNAPGEGAFRSQ